MPETTAHPAQPPEARSSAGVKLLPGHGRAQDPTRPMRWEKPVLPSAVLLSLDGSLRSRVCSEPVQTHCTDGASLELQEQGANPASPMIHAE